MSRFYDTEKFIELAIKVHGNTYDYSKVNYKNSVTKVKIQCLIHGEFTLKPSKHLIGRGCKYCSYDQIKLNSRSNIEEFIRKAQEVHGEKYDYRDSEYINSRTRLIITCETHGVFKQTPVSHIQGKGCPLCAPSGFMFNKPAILYYIEYNGLFKIGVTKNKLSKRYSSIHKNIRVIKTWKFDVGRDAYDKELEIKQKFKLYNIEDINPITNTISKEVFSKDVLKLLS